MVVGKDNNPITPSRSMKGNQMGMAKKNMTLAQQVQYMDRLLSMAMFELASCKERMNNEWEEDDEDILEYLRAYVLLDYAALIMDTRGVQ